MFYFTVCTLLLLAQATCQTVLTVMAILCVVSHGKSGYRKKRALSYGPFARGCPQSTLSVRLSADQLGLERTATHLHHKKKKLTSYFSSFLSYLAVRKSSLSHRPIIFCTLAAFE